MASTLFIGLISGTSADGVDAVLVDFADRPRLLGALLAPYPARIRDRLLALAAGAGLTCAGELARLDVEVGELFAEAALALCRKTKVQPAQVTAIGSHGQTVQHGADQQPAWTLQIGDPSRIVERTGILTVADFRRRDLAAGGQGAPLVPAFHHAWLREHADVILNLGGIANLSLLADAPDEVTGFDTGPANALLDAWAERCLNQPHDAGGRWADGAAPDPELLDEWLKHPYFAAPPPKSTGRETFTLAWALAARASRGRSAEVIQSTLCELSAASIAEALLRARPEAKTVLACGGGVHNLSLMRRLAARLPGVRLGTTAEAGLDPDWIEAMAFAWLAQRTLAGQPGNLPAVTGARGPRILGAIYPP